MQLFYTKSWRWSIIHLLFKTLLLIDAYFQRHSWALFQYSDNWYLPEFCVQRKMASNVMNLCLISESYVIDLFIHSD